MKSLTNQRDLDREILLKLNDRDFLLTCNSSRYLRENVCDEQFFKKRLTLTYPDTLNYNLNNKSWRQYYIETVFHVAKMKEYGYDYSFGNPKKQYMIILKSHSDNNHILLDASKKGELALAIESLKRGVKNHPANFTRVEDDALTNAIENGHLDIVKYLVEHGAEVDIFDFAYTKAIKKGYTDIIKYLEERFF
jgi:hypothetical protein